MNKYALFVFNGDPMCFIHVLLNAMAFKGKGHEAGIILEGSSVQLIPELIKTEHPLYKLWNKAIDKDLIEGVCKACATKLGTLEDAKQQGLRLLDDMAGHPAMSNYIDKGYQIITF